LALAFFVLGTKWRSQREGLGGWARLRSTNARVSVILEGEDYGSKVSITPYVTSEIPADPGGERTNLT
jgi:hypothetical protein